MIIKSKVFSKLPFWVVDTIAVQELAGVQSEILYCGEIYTMK